MAEFTFEIDAPEPLSEARLDEYREALASLLGIPLDSVTVDRRSSPAQAAMPDGDGWNYYGNPPDGTDCRKLVTLVAGDMTWIGIRAFHHANRRWMNNGEPERDTVKAWRDLPEIARGFWQRGELRFPGQDEQEMGERLEAVLRPMVGWSAPAEGDPND